MRVDDSLLNGLRQEEYKVVGKDTSAEANALTRSAPPTMGAPILLIVVGAFAAYKVWSVTIEMIREYYYGGVVIDASVSPINIKNSKAIPAGMVFVILAGGKIEQYRAVDFRQDVLEGLLKRSGAATRG